MPRGRLRLVTPVRDLLFSVREPIKSNDIEFEKEPEPQLRLHMSSLFRLSAILFDLDGTITTHGHLDFPKIRSAIGCPEGLSILEHIDSLPPAEKGRAEKTLDEYEMAAAASVSAAPGLFDILQFASENSIRLGILTRNTRRAVDRSCSVIPKLDIGLFSCVVTRDDPIPVKPAPDGVIYAASLMRVPLGDTLVVGDYIYDIEAGQRAGARTCFIDALRSRSYAAPEADFVVSDLRSLIAIMQPLKRPIDS